MDKLDYLILSELLRDARIPFLTIAKSVGVSPYTVRKRYDEMKKSGIIRRCVVSIDLSRLGYQGKLFLLITNKPKESKASTIAALEKMRNIISTSEMIGAFDIIAVAPVTDFESIKKIVNEIREVPSVQRVEVACINDTAFPLNSSFGKILSQKSYELATKH
jgi:Lrp/AsnC family transcriptional regulator for asnA, asnC and gidA